MKRTQGMLFLWCVLWMSLAVTAEEPLLVLNPQGHSGSINAVLFTPDGTRLISVSNDKTINIWDAATGELLKTLRGQISNSEGPLYAGALSPDGKILAVGGTLEPKRGGIRLFQFDTGEQLATLKGHTGPVDTLAFSPDGQWLASGSGDETIRLWDLSALPSSDDSLKSTFTLREHADVVESVAFVSNGTKLVSSAYDGAVILWDWRQQTILKKWSAGVVSGSPDGAYLLTASGDGTVLLWDSNGQFVRELESVEDVGALAFSVDSQRVVVTDEAIHQAIVYTVPSGEKITTFTKHTEQVNKAAFSGNHTIATAGYGGDIYLWDATTGAVKTHIASKGQTVWAVAFGKDSQLAFGNTGQYENDLNRGPLERTFDFVELLLNRKAADEREFQRSRAASQNQTLKLLNPYELQVNSAGVIVTSREDYEQIRCYTFTPDGNVVVGTFFSLKLYRPDGTLLREFWAHTGEILAVAVSDDGRLLASASVDQTIKLWNLQSGELLASLFAATDQEWICWTPQGYYAASAGGEKYIGWHVNQGEGKTAKFYPVSVFRKQFYQPELVKRTIAVGSFEQALVEINVDAAEKIQPTSVTQVFPPQVRWIAPQESGLKTSEPALHVQAAIASESPLTTVKILVNGRTQAVQRGLNLATPSQPRGGNGIDQDIVLLPGKNDIVIFAANEQAGASSEVRTVFYTAEALQSALYMVSIGISEYSRGNFNLRYADDDARAISQVFRGQAGKLYQPVNLKELYNGDATQANIFNALASLKTMVTQKDVVVIFIAAHGFNEQGRYYLLPTDGDPDDLERTAVSWEMFTSQLGDVPARVLFLLDTCHSGQIGQDLLTRQRADNTEALRELSSDEYGIVILAASTGREYSLEDAEWAHGAFTKALLEALDAGQADYSNDGWIDLRELDLYVADRVEALTNGVQHPTTQKPSTISRFPVVQVGNY